MVVQLFSSGEGGMGRGEGFVLNHAYARNIGIIAYLGKIASAVSIGRCGNNHKTKLC